MEEIYVHPHAFKHGLREREIRYAWDHCVAAQLRKPPREEQLAVVGTDMWGRVVQMVGVRKNHGMLIYHAMTPPTRGFLEELGLR